VRRERTRALLTRVRPRAEFPHLYAHLEGENVESFRDVFQEGGDWATALNKAEIKGWLE
jgi:uncharacterized protein (DUF952 family)